MIIRNFKGGKRTKGFTLIEVLTVVFILATIVSLVVPYLRRSVQKAKLAGCQSNLRNLANSCQLYAYEHNRMYPSQLRDVSPTYMKVIPTCPAVELDTYTSGYEITSDLKYYTIKCNGSNHTSLGFGANEPYYNLTRGLGP